MRVKPQAAKARLFGTWFGIDFSWTEASRTGRPYRLSRKQGDLESG